MIEKIAPNSPVQGSSYEKAASIPSGKEFAEELAAATKKEEVKAQANDPQEKKGNGCCGNDDKDSKPGTPLASG